MPEVKFQDDKFTHLIRDIDKMRQRYRMYISFSNEAGAKAVVDEILFNALDECISPRSPGNKIQIKFDENTGFIEVSDNGRGIPTAIMEELFTSLNSGSNIDSADKANLKSEVLGMNGVGTLAICALAEHVEITSYRGGTENKFKTLIYEEGEKISENEGKCNPDKHGLSISYKPSKVMGKNTKIVWEPIRSELDDLQFLNKKNISITSIYYDKKGKENVEKYKNLTFKDILDRNIKDTIISNKYALTVADDNVIEDLSGIQVKRYLEMDIAFVYTSSLTPYIDSFTNQHANPDNGDHLDGTIEAVCRFFQAATKNGMSEKEKNSLDVKWDDVKQGLSIAVAMRTNYERLYTGQTKHKVVSPEIRRIIINLVTEGLTRYFSKNPGQLKDICNIVKMNARARREGDKVRTAVVKNTINNWSSYKMKNYDPCTRKGTREYKELFIIEGDSAKGSLKPARFAEFQALFAIRGVSANVFKMTLDQIVGPKGNREFTDLITVMGCNVGAKFDISKLQFNKIIIASDADIDGLFIRSLLMAFFFKLFPEVIEDGRLFIAEPPLYRVNDQKNPYVINMADYINRYVKAASKDYKLGYETENGVPEYMSKDDLISILSDTAEYVDDIAMLGNRYMINERLLEIILEEFAMMSYDEEQLMKSYVTVIPDMFHQLNIQHLLDRITPEFPEIFYDDKDNLIRGIIDGKYQLLEITPSMIRRCRDQINIIKKWGPRENEHLVLYGIKDGVEYRYGILETLKILKKYQPRILHRFKGLGENDPEDIRTCLMDPNTRMLIKVNIKDIENDMKIFQILRGNSPTDILNRKTMMKEFRIPKSMIDT